MLRIFNKTTILKIKNFQDVSNIDTTTILD